MEPDIGALSAIETIKTFAYFYTRTRLGIYGKVFRFAMKWRQIKPLLLCT